MGFNKKKTYKLLFNKITKLNMNHCVSKLQNITPKSIVKLSKLGITTIKHLSEQDPYTLKVRNSHQLIANAQKYIKKTNNIQVSTSPSSNPPPTPIPTPIIDSKKIDQTDFMTTLDMGSELPFDFNLDIGNNDDDDDDDEPLTQLERVMVQDHSWWELKVLIPTESGELENAVIYEMSIDPTSRISFVCVWNINDGKSDEAEKVAEMTYSPQMIYHYNISSLPKLTVAICENEFNNLNNKWALKNTLWEANMMRKTHMSSI